MPSERRFIGVRVGGFFTTASLKPNRRRSGEYTHAKKWRGGALMQCAGNDEQWGSRYGTTRVGGENTRRREQEFTIEVTEIPPAPWRELGVFK